MADKGTGTGMGMEKGLVIEDCSGNDGKKEEMSIHKPFTIHKSAVRHGWYCGTCTVRSVSMVDGGWWMVDGASRMSLIP